MNFTNIINPFHSSRILRENHRDLWEWISNLEISIQRQEKLIVELEQRNKYLEERIEELENEKNDLANYADELDNRLRINEERTSLHLEKQTTAIQQLFIKQNKSDTTIRDTQEVIERLLINVSKVERIGTSNEN